MEAVDSRADDFKLYLDLQSEDPATWVQLVNDANSKMWYKEIPNTDLYYIRIEGHIEGDYDFEKFSNLAFDLEKMKQWEKNAKVLETIEKIDENSDVIYIEIKMPFPFENRDMVQKRISINNKKHPELVKKYGLFEQDNEYVIIQAQSVERSEKPVMKKITRANTVLSVCVMSKDPKISNRINIKMIVCNDVKVKIPNMLRNMMLKQMGKMMISTLTDAYKKLYKKK